MLAYCYATEIAFKTLSGQDVSDFMMEVGEALTNDTMPDIEKTTFLIIAAITSYYNRQLQEPPVKDTDIISDATPLEFGTALGTVLTLRNRFYGVPAGEPEDKPEEGKGSQKNS